MAPYSEGASNLASTMDTISDTACAPTLSANFQNTPLNTDFLLEFIFT